MQLILVRNHGAKARVISGLWLLVVGLVLGAAMSAGGYWLWQSAINYQREQMPAYSEADLENLVAQWQDELNKSQAVLQASANDAQLQLDALTARTASLQARITRLDALGEHLLAVSNIESDEFNFGADPAVGGPEAEELAEFTAPQFVDVLSSLEADLRDRQTQLELLESLIRNRDFEAATFVAGRPIESGWLSSRFGYRTDPFNGKIAWHSGIDFAGKEGSNVIAVASGIVTFADERSGYGLLVELNHGNGVVTRYAHSKELLVNVGDVIHKGQPVALMGSTGRSTGPHVHFEVLRNGKRVDPLTYIQRSASR
ncbi:peptidoglycan DD-metalloendopeptidase family protein [Salinibius halmophilus]|uniref:peptidoglycan DD-metalloendopeptidase family protein n=1 Tax=Salinibius halmophilus TaxID=1853216 RepID=UPI000E673748|nr:peptidoglycan DD-metalloendopeptidase family protein [Salinibius halmophilus]